MRLNIKKVQIFGSGLYLLHLLININMAIPNNVISKLMERINFLPGSAVSNALYIGIPFMSFGVYLRGGKNTNKKYCLIMMLISIIGLYIESSIFYNIFKISEITYYFFTVGIAVPLFLLLSELKISGKNFIFIRNLSAIIYCIHPLWIEIYKNVIDKCNYSMQFVWTVFMSCLSGTIIIALSKKISYMKKLY